ncbi:hypothetical protein ACFXPI_33550 [Streptomyces sp. NPDC059104]|uniref:hypothetical protein n=1 Tax=Streptomyces sp. NPDC059104 TaxID=3346729 RepID=UPI0036942894
MKYIETQTLPSLGHAEVRIIAHTPEAARAVAEALRRCFAGAEQRSYPALDGNTRLHLTVDTATPSGPAPSRQPPPRDPDSTPRCGRTSRSAGRTPGPWPR